MGTLHPITLVWLIADRNLLGCLGLVRGAVTPQGCERSNTPGVRGGFETPKSFLQMIFDCSIGDESTLTIPPPPLQTWSKDCATACLRLNSGLAHSPVTVVAPTEANHQPRHAFAEWRCVRGHSPAPNQPGSWSAPCVCRTGRCRRNPGSSSTCSTSTRNAFSAFVCP